MTKLRFGRGSDAHVGRARICDVIFYRSISCPRFACARLSCSGPAMAAMDPFELLAIAGSSRAAPKPAHEGLHWVRRCAVACRADRRRPPRKRTTANQSLAAEVQVEHHNREKAARKDDRMFWHSRGPTVAGSGRWKQLTADEVLRVAFSSPAATISSVASRVGSSVRYVTDLLFTCAGLLNNKQGKALGVG